MLQRQNDLDQLFNKTFGWIVKNEKNFSVGSFLGTSRILELIKPLGELVLSCSILKQILGGEVKEEADHLLNFAWEELGKGCVLEEILISRPDFLILTSIYGTFKAEGFISAKLEQEITKIAGAPGYSNLDLPAWRQLDLIFGLKQVGVQIDANINSVFKRTWLAGHHVPWTITNASAYGVTHTVFYLTDYGKFPDGLPLETRSYLKKALPIWMDHYLRQENYDLAAEMIMALFCIGVKVLDKKISRQLKNGQQIDGSMSAPQLGAMNLLFGEEDIKRRYFLTNYHTTIVTCVASAMFSSYKKNSKSYRVHL